jgi:FkbM family methyltransferase
MSVHRRDFIAGAACGTAVAVGGGACVSWMVSGSPTVQPAQRSAPPVPDHARLSFAQQGEDIVLFHLLHDLMQIETPTYLDIGAAHPQQASNTYLLYTTGARGVLVEPNPAFTAELRLHRPGDIVVEAGIGVDDATEADYFEIKGQPLLNTFSSEQVARLQRGHTETVVERVVKMPLIGINRLIRERLGRAPDLLSTDIEGLDAAILRTLDLSLFRPAVICAEAIATLASGRPSPLTRYLASRDYIPRGGSMHNAIYVDARRLQGVSASLND